MDATLFRRIVAGIPRTGDTWSERAKQDQNLEDFLPYSEEVIATIAAFLHGQEDATSSALSNNDNDEEEEEAVGWGDEVDIATRDLQLILGLTTFCVDGISPDIIKAFVVLQASDAWRSADRCRTQITLSVSLPTHSSHLTQPLDVGLFAIHKSAVH
jgi:hypothetical protein